MVHWKAYHLVGHLCCHRQILWGGTGETAIGAEGADEGIEIATAPDALLLHLEIEFIAGHAVFLGINENGEIAIVMAHTGHIVEETDAGDVAQGFTVAGGNFLTGGNGGIDLF